MILRCINVMPSDLESTMFNIKSRPDTHCIEAVVLCRHSLTTPEE